MVQTYCASALGKSDPGCADACPFIATSPKVDGTDFYMFMSYESGRSDYVTLIAN